MLGFVLLTTRFVPEHPVAIAIWAMLLVGQSVGRALLLRRVPDDDASEAREWRKRLTASHLAAGVTWGLFLGWACAVYGYRDISTIQMIIYHGVLATFGVSYFAESVRLGRLYVLAMFAPALAATVAFPDPPLWQALLGMSAFAVALLRHVTRQHSEFVRLHTAEERYTLAIAGNNDGIWEWDLTTGRVYFSERWKQLMGFDAASATGTIDDWLRLVHPDDHKSLCLHLDRYIEGGDNRFEFEHRVRLRDGTWRWIQVFAAAVRDRKGRAVRIAGSKADITSSKLKDPLTGLANRLGVLSRIEQLIERQRQYPEHTFTVMLLDLDRFKLVNDSLGHVVGDQLLQGVGGRILQAAGDLLGPAGSVGHLGGDEFVILVDGHSEAGWVTALAARVHAALEQPLLVGRGTRGNWAQQTVPVFLRGSMGIAFSDGSLTAEDLLRNADAAMYRAKAEGRGCYRVYDSGMHHAALARLQLELDLRQAIERQEFVAYFQPQVDLATGCLVGFEALARWKHPSRGLVMPDEFIPVAEESGAILPLGRQMLRAACGQLARWRAEFPHASGLSMSVNLSAKQFSDPQLPDDVRALLAETGLPPGLLHLEITESIVADDPDMARRVLEEFQRIGIPLEIDDFGTGYSSLGQLHRLPFSTMKVDRSFVRSMNEDQGGNKIVQSITSLARSLGITIVAEGIETEQHWKLLHELGCQYGQGYYFARPAEASVMCELLQRGTTQLWPRPSFQDSLLRLATVSEESEVAVDR